MRIKSPFLLAADLLPALPCRAHRSPRTPTRHRLHRHPPPNGYPMPRRRMVLSSASPSSPMPNSDLTGQGDSPRFPAPPPDDDRASQRRPRRSGPDLGRPRQPRKAAGMGRFQNAPPRFPRPRPSSTSPATTTSPAGRSTWKRGRRRHPPRAYAKYAAAMGPGFFVKEVAGMRAIGVAGSLFGSGLPEEEQQWIVYARAGPPPAPSPLAHRGLLPLPTLHQVAGRTRRRLLEHRTRTPPPLSSRLATWVASCAAPTAIAITPSPPGCRSACPASMPCRGLGHPERHASLRRLDLGRDSRKARRTNLVNAIRPTASPWLIR